jgi:hypothetical protein
MMGYAGGGEPHMKENKRLFNIFTKFQSGRGIFIADEVFQELYERRRHIMSAAGKPMKQVMSGEQKRLFRDRSCIETAGGVLKERFQLA